MALVLITPPTDFPISLEEMKDRIGVSASDNDRKLSGLLNGATVQLERYLNRAFMPQVWDLIYDRFPADGDVQIPIAPLISVTSVNYIDATTQVETGANVNSYYVDVASEPGWILVGEDGWPDLFETANAVRIRFLAGYPLLGSEGSPATPGVPAPLIDAICELVRVRFDNLEVPVAGDALLPTHIRAMVASYRIFA